MAAPMDEENDLVETDDYYAWLGLSKEASKEEVNNAFRRLSRVYHPDKHLANPERKEQAEEYFTKIKKAHEVLSDPNKKAIYDTMGVKGLETEGWEVVPRTKTPAEILEEYERLEKEREERRLQQRTNPKGSVTVGVDATDLFEPYEALDALEYRPILPHLEVSSMSIQQSVEAPLTTKDTAVMSGRLSTHNGNGSGAITATYRRVISHQGWAEVEVSAGQGASISVRGFRTLWHRTFGTMSGSLQLTPKGLRPSFSTMVATQLDKNLQGRLVWNAGSGSSMQTMVVWDTQRHHLMVALQLGLNSTFVSLSYVHKFETDEARAKGSIRLGTFGALLEYGCEKKISQFSHLGATVVLGVPVGVTLKIKLNRGNQTYMFPVHLADSIVPSAVFYGTVLPLLAYFVVKTLLVNPFLKKQKEKDLIDKKDANAKRLSQKKKDAEAALELMTETVERSIEVEERKSGLVITKALYGKLAGEELRDQDCLTVTRQLQALVKDSKLYLPEGTQLSELPGFYDPCVGEEKQLVVIYKFRGHLHQCQIPEKQKILLPNRDHICDTSNQETSSFPEREA